MSVLPPGVEEVLRGRLTVLEYARSLRRSEEKKEASSSFLLILATFAIGGAGLISVQPSMVLTSLVFLFLSIRLDSARRQQRAFREALIAAFARRHWHQQPPEDRGPAFPLRLNRGRVLKRQRDLDRALSWKGYGAILAPTWMLRMIAEPDYPPPDVPLSRIVRRYGDQTFSDGRTMGWVMVALGSALPLLSPSMWAIMWPLQIMGILQVMAGRHGENRAIKEAYRLQDLLDESEIRFGTPGERAPTGNGTESAQQPTQDGKALS